MQQVLINKLKEEVLGLQYYRIYENGLPCGVWFVFETSPLPPFQQIEMVIADLQKDKEIYFFYDGTLGHSVNCKEQAHSIEKNLKATVNSLTKQKFRVAIWENNGEVLEGQPVIIPLEPQINYSLYPDHPHISSGIPESYYYLPESICYTDNPRALGNNQYEKTKEAIEQASIWLFKHQVWLATRDTGKGIWIGPDVKAKDKEQFHYRRNPYGKCWCGSNKEYHQCHLNQDFRYAYESELPLMRKDHSLAKFKDEYGDINLMLYCKWWMEHVNNPQNVKMAQLKRILR